MRYQHHFCFAFAKFAFSGSFAKQTTVVCLSCHQSGSLRCCWRFVCPMAKKLSFKSCLAAVEGLDPCKYQLLSLKICNAVYSLFLAEFSPHQGLCCRMLPEHWEDALGHLCGITHEVREASPPHCFLLSVTELMGTTGHPCLCLLGMASVHQQHTSCAWCFPCMCLRQGEWSKCAVRKGGCKCPSCPAQHLAHSC